MYPYLKENVRIRYDLENPVIFQKNGHQWFDESLNHDGLLLLRFCDGNHSLPIILKKLKKFFPNEKEENLSLKIKQFFVTARLKGYLDFLEKPVKMPIFYIGKLKKIFPGAIVLEITNQCNLDCKHCYLKNKKTLFLDLEFLKKFLTSVNKKGVFELQITGGEPFLYPKIIDLIEFCVENFFRVVLVTNGTLITEKIAKILSQFKNLSFQISLDGDEKTHNLIRGSNYAFSLMATGVKNLIEAGNKVKLSATISSLNINRMEEIALTALELKANFLEYGAVIPVGRAKELKPLSLNDHKFIYENVRSLAEIYKNKGLYIKFYNEQFNFKCELIKNLIFINSEGNVYPCVGINCFIGNIKKSSLEEILSKEKIKKISQLCAPSEIICGDCKFLEFCKGCHLQGLKNSALKKKCIYKNCAKKIGLNF